MPSIAEPNTQKASSNLSMTLITPFLESVRTVFRTMANVDTKVLKPYLKVSAGEYNVFGIIGFSGDLTGAVTVSFTLDSAQKLVEAFTGAKVDVSSTDFADAIGELANMIAGSAKSKLGFKATISIPSVIIGQQCHVAPQSGMPCIVIPCTSALGDFAVEVCMKQKKAVPSQGATL